MSLRSYLFNDCGKLHNKKLIVRKWEPENGEENDEQPDSDEEMKSDENKGDGGSENKMSSEGGKSGGSENSDSGEEEMNTGMDGE